LKEKMLIVQEMPAAVEAGSCEGAAAHFGVGGTKYQRPLLLNMVRDW